MKDNGIRDIVELCLLAVDPDKVEEIQESPEVYGETIVHLAFPISSNLAYDFFQYYIDKTLVDDKRRNFKYLDGDFDRLNSIVVIPISSDDFEFHWNGKIYKYAIIESVRECDDGNFEVVIMASRVDTK